MALVAGVVVFFLRALLQGGGKEVSFGKSNFNLSANNLELYQSGSTEIRIIDGVVKTLKKEGVDIDPESDEGKDLVAQARRLHKESMDQLDRDMKKMREDMDRNFKKMREDMDRTFRR